MDRGKFMNRNVLTSDRCRHKRIQFIGRGHKTAIKDKTKQTKKGTEKKQDTQRHQQTPSDPYLNTCHASQNYLSHQRRTYP